jgi:hypothetical protein
MSQYEHSISLCCDAQMRVQQLAMHLHSLFLLFNVCPCKWMFWRVGQPVAGCWQEVCNDSLGLPSTTELEIV